MSSGKRIATMVIGMIVMVGGFFGGFIQFFWIDTSNVGTILFYVLVVPMVSFLVGAGIMLYGMRDSLSTGGFGMFGMMRAAASEAPKEKSYVYEPPRFCTECGASISSEQIEWVGPLSVKCPYCGATLATEKREI
ncbi:MAG: hypothetical protein EAX87_12535 [Candidatus Thorarchaeota archaeon]|nr:hypothetical protein [Candidatus Thorarchaeota archaeon]